MINLGIIIAVSNYAGELENLPGCRRDGEAIAALLDRVKRFDEVLILTDDTSSKKIKVAISEFVQKSKGKEIGEVLFYFTGHGEFIDDEFYFLLTDSRSNQRKSTSLQNSELDTLIRSLSPELFVKIVDACYSGTTYIKSSNLLKDYFNNNPSSFKKLYFMFSSQANQRSYQTDEISDFTASFLKSLIAIRSGSIRYKDIADYISDEFQEFGFQTPLFVVQADFTEIFGECTDDLISVLNPYLRISDNRNPAEDRPAIERTPLYEVVKKDALRYCTARELEDILGKLPNFLDKVRLSDDIAPLFETSVSTQSYLVFGKEEIGRWLDSHKSESGYLAKVLTATRTVKRRNTLSMLYVDAFLQSDPIETFVTGFEFTIEMPYHHISIDAKPNTPNLALETFLIVAIPSRTDLRLFWSGQHFAYVTWDSMTCIESTEWNTEEVPLRDSARLQEICDKIVQSFVTFVEAPIRAKWDSQK